MRTLIAGLGSIGRRHLRNLQALGESDIVLLRTHMSTLPEEELAGLPVVSSIGEGLDLRPQAVIVANPTAYHLDVAIPAAEAGCHLLIEKPVSHTMRGVRELLGSAGRSGSRILVGFQFRFHPCLQYLRQLLADGALGSCLYARATYAEYLPGWHPWEDYRAGYSARADLGGGAVLTLSHPLDYLSLLFGSPSHLLARSRPLPHLALQGVEGLADILMEHPGGMLTAVHLDYAQRPPAHTLEVVGSEGRAACDFLSGEMRWWTAASATWREHSVPPGFERNDLFLDELRHFRAVVEQGITPACGLEEGVASLKVALAAIEASQVPAPLTFEAGARNGAARQLPRSEVGDG